MIKVIKTPRERIHENAKARVYTWRKRNRERYNAYMREYWAKRKLQSLSDTEEAGAHLIEESHKQTGSSF